MVSNYRFIAISVAHTKSAGKRETLKNCRQRIWDTYTNDFHFGCELFEVFKIKFGEKFFNSASRTFTFTRKTVSILSWALKAKLSTLFENVL